MQVFMIKATSLSPAAKIVLLHIEIVFFLAQNRHYASRSVLHSYVLLVEYFFMSDAT